MKIAIIGTGNVGGALGRVWSAKGHEVVYGARNLGKARAQQAAERAGGSLATVPDAAAEAEVVLLAVPADQVDDVLREAGDLAGKILIDATNAVGGGYRPSVTGAESQAEVVARLEPGAKVVKAFNTVGAGMMGDLGRLEGRAVAPICGNDMRAKAVVRKLGDDLGFEVVDVGPLAAAPLVESAALLWMTLSYRQGLGTEWAFGILRPR